MMLLKVLLQRVMLQVRKWSMAAGSGCSDRIADEEVLFKHEILPLTECYAGCELPFSSYPGFSSSPLAEAAADPETLPWGRAEDTGAAGLSSCLMPTIGPRAAMPERRLIRNMGIAPSFTSVTLSQDMFEPICYVLYVKSKTIHD